LVQKLKEEVTRT